MHLQQRKVVVRICLFIMVIQISVMKAFASPWCKCRAQKNVLSASCVLKNLTDLNNLLTRPQDIISLDLSSNEVTEVPVGIFRNFTNLQSLSLANNSITKLESRVFRGLRNLKSLNISLNPLKSWNGNLSDSLTSLEKLDVTGINSWAPDTKIMELTTLTEIAGASWNKQCSRCSLVKRFSLYTNSSQPRCSKIENVARGMCTDCLPVKCTCTKYLFSNRSTNFARHGFTFGKCSVSDLARCFNSLSLKQLDGPCARRNAFLLAVIQYPISFTGIVLNLVTVFNILSTKSLWSNVPMLLISNMALCDLSSCFYAFIITTILLGVPYESFLDNVRRICLPLGLLWFVGICGSTIVSSLLTIERYLTIVFVMKPQVRMRLKIAAMLLALTWLVVLTLGFYSLAEEFSTHNSFCVPGAATEKSPKHLRFLTSVGIIGMMLFVVNLFLYIHIYLVVRKSQNNMGIKRESRTAKRIAALVFTNMVFFFAPVFMTKILVISDTYPTIQADGKGEIWRMVVTMYFSVVCFNLNACINPLWYSFRNKKFKESLKKKSVSLMSYLRSFCQNIEVCSSNKSTDEPNPRDNKDIETNECLVYVTARNDVDPEKVRVSFH